MKFDCTLKIKSDTRYISFVRGFVAAVAKANKLKISKEALIACNLSLVEAVNNVIFHAHKNCRGVPIKIRIAVDGQTLSMEVCDSGKGLGRHVKIAPDSMSTHGRGLFLIHRLMTQVISRRRGSLHILRMVKKI